MQSQEQKIVITLENVAPTNGTSLAPVWFGFHNGKFDGFDAGKKASAAIETLAEDGSPAPLTQEFSDKGYGTAQGTLVNPLGGAIVTGVVAQSKIEIDGSDASSRYFSYAGMILPSNDQFIANDDAREYQIFDKNGQFLGAEIIVGRGDAWDAGTEVNDEIPENTAFFGQTTPNTGVDENGVVTQGEGFLPQGSGGILDDPRFADADYTVKGYQFATIRIANLVEGTKESDTLFGTAAPDDIYTGGGDNFVLAKDGNDRIYARAGNDYLVGGAGDDLIDAGNGNNKLRGGEGNDRLYSGNGNDIIFGGAGDDSIDSGIGDDKVFLGSGKDLVVLNAGKGADKIYSFENDDRFSLGAGSIDRDNLFLKTSGGDTSIYYGKDLLATVYDIELEDLTIV
jgi:Ca2+-binding RTX toxin-like protein